MKKLILLATLFAILSCSSSDNNSTSSNISFNPPSWIQGTWIGIIGSGYKFTTNNVCQIVSTNQNCFNEMLQMYSGSGGSVSVVESINTNTEYKFSYTVQSSTTEFYFKKGATNNVIYIFSNGSNTPLTKQ